VESVFDRIAEGIDQVNQKMVEVTEAGARQETEITSIKGEVTYLDQLTQNGAANAEESAASARELSGQARQIDVEVENLVVVVGSKAQSLSAAAYQDPARNPVVKPAAYSSQPTSPSAGVSSGSSASSGNEDLGNVVVALEEEDLLEI